jgi:hypothetical protein
MSLNNLLQGRVQCLYADLDKICTETRGMSWGEFKDYWKQHNLSLLHHSLRSTESRVEFMRAAWGYLLDRIYNEGDIALLFILYTLYYTQISDPIRIRIDIETWNLIFSLTTHSLAAKMIKRLTQDSAFVFGAHCDVRVSLPKSDAPVKMLTEESNETDLSILRSSLVDWNTLKQNSMNYAIKKQQILETPDLLLENPEGILSSDPLKQLLFSNNRNLLNLANSLFPESIEHLYSQIGKP